MLKKTQPRKRQSWEMMSSLIWRFFQKNLMPILSMLRIGYGCKEPTTDCHRNRQLLWVARFFRILTLVIFCIKQMRRMWGFYTMFCPQRAYQLMQLQIFYMGLASKVACMMIVAWREEIEEMVQSFKVIITSKVWQFIIIHRLDQYHLVKIVLDEECNSGIQSHVW